MRRAPIVIAVAAAAVGFGAVAALPAAALDLTLHGYADLRAVSTPEELEWTEGGLGKTRFGGDDSSGRTGLRVGELAVAGTLTLDPTLAFKAYVRAEPTQQTVLDVIEAYARWRPDFADGALSLRLGAFFQPGSLESFPPMTLGGDPEAPKSGWTLTPSAINTWISEELKTVGAEARWRVELGGDTLDLTGGVYGWNDPAGILIAYRGWALHERWGGLIDTHRLPDEVPLHSGGRPPANVEVFKEIDDRPGWYLGLRWQRADGVALSLLRYDNNADVRARRRQAAWDTRYWNLGLELPLPGGAVLLAQAMTGDTVIAPTAPARSVTEYESAFLLLGKDMGDWRLGLRGDLFGTRERGPANRVEFSEHGWAATLAATQMFGRHVSVGAELLHVDSYRSQRIAIGLPANSSGTQAQIATRLYF